MTILPKKIKSIYGGLLCLLLTTTANAQLLPTLALLFIAPVVSSNSTNTNLYHYKINANTYQVHSLNESYCLLDTQGYMTCKNLNKAFISQYNLGNQGYAFIDEISMTTRRSNPIYISNTNVNITGTFSEASSSTLHFMEGTPYNQLSFFYETNIRVRFAGGTYITNTTDAPYLFLYGIYTINTGDSSVILQVVNLQQTTTQEATFLFNFDNYYRLDKCVLRSIFPFSASCIGLFAEVNTPTLLDYNFDTYSLRNILTPSGYPLLAYIKDIESPLKDDKLYIIIRTTTHNNEFITIDKTESLTDILSFPTPLYIFCIKTYNQDSNYLLGGSYLNGLFFSKFEKTHCNTNQIGSKCPITGWYNPNRAENITNISIGASGIATMISPKGTVIDLNLSSNEIFCDEFVKISLNATIKAPIINRSAVELGPYDYSEDYTITQQYSSHTDPVDTNISFLCPITIKENRSNSTIWYEKVLDNIGWVFGAVIITFCLAITCFLTKRKLEKSETKKYEKYYLKDPKKNRGDIKVLGSIAPKKKNPIRVKRKKKQKRKRHRDKRTQLKKEIVLDMQNEKMEAKIKELQEKINRRKTNLSQPPPEIEPSESKKSQESSEVEGIAPNAQED